MGGPQYSTLFLEEKRERMKKNKNRKKRKKTPRKLESLM